MSPRTVKPALTRKRAKRVVENDAYAAFLRRVLRAHGRRIAAGDVEALPGLAVLAAEVDTAMRTAIAGLRDFGYSWSEIAARLGVTRQAAQMRYGTPAERGTLDRQLLDAGLTITIPVLVHLFTTHHPGAPLPATCPGCGYRYPDATTDCPTLAVVRSLLYRRRTEDPAALDRLTGDQYADLHNRPRLPVSTAGAAGPDDGRRPLFPISTGAGAP